MTRRVGGWTSLTGVIVFTDDMEEMVWSTERSLWVCPGNLIDAPLKRENDRSVPRVAGTSRFARSTRKVSVVWSRLALHYYSGEVVSYDMLIAKFHNVCPRDDATGLPAGQGQQRAQQQPNP